MQINLRIRDDLVERLDAMRGDVPRSRYIERLIEGNHPAPAAVPAGLTKPHAGQWGGIGGRPPIAKADKK